MGNGMTKKKTVLQKLRSGMAARIIGAIMLLLVVFGLVVSTIGFVSFTNAFKREYAESTYHMMEYHGNGGNEKHE